MFKKAFALLLFCFVAEFAQAQLVINEVSQGSSGNREYVEFVVVGTPTCLQQCVDLRGWIIDDNNGFHAQGSGTGIAQGCIRFRNIPQWACVPFGSIILVYNESEKNTSISLADDPTDANNDKVYIIPANSNVLEGNAQFPSVPNGSSYTGFTFTTPAQWVFVEMGNGNDCFHTVAPTNITAPYHAVGWGNNTQNVDVYFNGSAGGKVFYNSNATDTNPFTQSNWVTANVAGNETPGFVNNTANGNWIQSLRNQSTVNTPVTTNRTACIINGQSVLIGGINRTTPGIYNDTLTSASGCDSIVITTLRVSTPFALPLNPTPTCDSFTFQGFVFKNDTTVRDTLLTSLGCDSVYITANIRVNKSKRDTVNACINLGENYFAGGALRTTAGFYNDNYTAANGCDSIVTTNLKLITPTTINQTLQNCNSVTLFGTTYTSSTMVRDTTFSAQQCDSVYTIYNIIISNILRDTIDVCINQGGSYFAAGANQTASGFYADTFQIGSSGCDSIGVVNLNVINPTAQSQSIAACNSYTYKGITYSSPATIIDTIKSVLACDSIYNTINITITQNIETQIDVCINNGESYFAGGALQTMSGAYKDTFPSSTNCDSIVTTNLNVITVTTAIADIIACNSYTLNGVTYTTSIDVSDTIRNNQGCITSITINSIFIDGNKYDTITACINPGESYFAGGSNQTNSGLYYDTIPSLIQGNCPTFRSTFLELIVPKTDTLPVINAVDKIVINGTVYTENTVIENVSLSKQGCDSLLQFQPIVITKTPEGKLFMPNVFSPNGDNVNDLIEPLYNSSITILSFKIFNRWGEMIYNGQKGWDGYFNGTLQKPDAFVYTLSATDKSSGKTINLHGSLTLVM
mgnify:CR=1 FL=1